MRDPVERAYSDYRMAVRTPGHKWAGESAPYHTFEEMARAEMSKFDDCILRQSGVAHVDIVRTCFGHDSDRFTRGIYDYQINSWVSFYAQDRQFFCFIHSEYLFNHHDEAMSVIAEFIGLAPYDWAAHSVHAGDGSYKYNQSTSLQSIDSEVVSELQAFFQRHGSRYYDLVRVHGYHGCLPESENNHMGA